MRKGDFDVATHLMMEYKEVCTVMGLVALSPTTKDRKGRDGEQVTLKLWGRGPADGNNAVLQFQKREFDGGEGLQESFRAVSPKGKLPAAWSELKNRTE